MDMTDIFDILITIIITGGAWWINTMSFELKRLNILLNKTREDYATKTELRDDMNRLLEALHRVEDKLDRILSNR